MLSLVILIYMAVTMMIYEIDPSISTHEALLSNPELATVADEQYIKSKSGPRTAVGFSAAYISLSDFTTPEQLSTLAAQLPVMDSQLTRRRDHILAERFHSPDRIGQMEFVFDGGNYSPFFKSEAGKRYGTMMQMLQYPFSVGCIHIPSTISFEKPTTSDDKPVIDPQYYGGAGGQVDFLTMVAAQAFGHRICSTAPLRNIIRGRVFPAPSAKPATDVAAVGEDEDFSQWVRDSTITDWHPVGTCAMGGHQGIVGGVVDERLRVYGVRGLRVCDASVMPLIISGHLQATVYAIGEKGAAMILEDWGVAMTNGSS